MYRLSWPVPADTLFPFFYATGDTGKFVAAIIQNRKSLLNGRVPGASGWWSPQEVVDTFEEVTGKKAEYVPLLDGEAWKKTSGRGDKIAQELLENFWFLRDYKYYVTADPEGDVEKAKNVSTFLARIASSC